MQDVELLRPKAVKTFLQDGKSEKYGASSIYAAMKQSYVTLINGKTFLRFTNPKVSRSQISKNYSAKFLKINRPNSSNTSRSREGVYKGANREFVVWRKRWDSNPRTAQTVAGFQDRCIQPLCHTSANFLTRNVCYEKKLCSARTTSKTTFSSAQRMAKRTIHSKMTLSFPKSIFNLSP